MKKHIGRLLVAPELLAELLQFGGATNVKIGPDTTGTLLEVVIEHPDLPLVEVYPGDVLPGILAEFTLVYYPDGSVKGVKRSIPDHIAIQAGEGTD